MSNNSLNVLITRPDIPGRDLQHYLTSKGFSAACQPLFDYQPATSTIHIQTLLRTTNSPTVIFVSVAAVEYANQQLPISQWQVKRFLSVGNATQNALSALDIPSHCPKIQSSEGLLERPELSDVAGQDIIIVRGDGGRELLAEQLSTRQANVHYLESYQRVWRTITQQDVENWQKQQINCIVVTSNALLAYIVERLSIVDNKWAKECLWIVASSRIATKAEQLGLTHIINAQGANNQAIKNALLSAKK